LNYDRRDAPGQVILELPNPFSGESGSLRVLEREDCDRAELVGRVLSGAYDKPFVIEDDGSRSLYFCRDFTQSAMRLSDPYSLEFAYTRKMMGFLLFVHEPKRILMLGLGGGSLAKYCHRHLPLARTTVLEIDARILAFRDLFMIPPDDARLNIVLGDAAAYLRQCAEQPEVVMLDAFDRDGFSPSVGSWEFYSDVRDVLARQGVMVANQVGPSEQRLAHLEMIRSAFEGNVILLPVEDGGNQVVFAFRDASFEPRWRWIGGQAKSMRARYGLDFPRFAGKLERSRKLGYLQRTLRQAEAA
jgi:spermidine synthase